MAAECEVAAVLAMSPAQQRSFFEGGTDPAMGRKERGVAEIRGLGSVERIKANMVRLEELRAKTKR